MAFRRFGGIAVVAGLLVAFPGSFPGSLFGAPAFPSLGASPARADQICASPINLSPQPAAGDCLFILRAAVGAVRCFPSCACDPNDSGEVSVSDALICLNLSVGRPAAQACDCIGQRPNVVTHDIVPSEINNLSAAVVVRTDRPSAIRATVTGPDGSWPLPSSGYLVSPYTDYHVFWLLGMTPETDYSVQIDAFTADGGTAPLYSFSHRSGALPVDPLPHTTTTYLPSAMSPGFTLFNIGGGPWGRNLYIVNAAGDVVWYREGISGDIRRTERGTLLTFLANDHGSVNILEFDMMGITIHELDPLEVFGHDYLFHHEIFEMDNGHLLSIGLEMREIGGYPDGETHNVVGDVVVEFDWDGNVYADLSLLDILDPYRTPEGFDVGFYDDDFGGVPTKDWTHGNAVIHDPADDSFILSLRHQDAVVKVSRFGRLLWVLGEDHPSSTGDDAWPFLTVVGGTYQNHQHAPQITEQGTLLLYDNANASGLSRPVEFEIDEAAGTATQLWEWFDPSINPPVNAHFVGDADQLPGGNVLVTHGGRNVDPSAVNGRTAYLHMVEVQPSSGEKVWEMIIRDPATEPVTTRGYRAERIPSLYP